MLLIARARRGRLAARPRTARRADQGGAIALDVVTGACVLAIAGAIVLGIYIMAEQMSDPAIARRRRPRPVPTVLDMLRTRIDHDAFDAASSRSTRVAADLGYGDVRALPGSIAWIDRLREEGKRIARPASGERAEAALELAGIADRFDVVVSGLRAPSRASSRALEELDVAPDRAAASSASTPTSSRRRARRAARS